MKISLQAGDLVAIRTRARNAHLIGRVADAHQSIYLINRHIRGTTTFAQADTEVWAGQIEDVVKADDGQGLSDAMERLWMIAETWFTAERTAAPVQPKPLTQRLDLPERP